MASNIDNNNTGNFTCTIQTNLELVQTENKENGGMCQLFEFIDKEKRVDPMKCPEKMEELKPISFKSFKDAGGKNSFPDVFLFAVKYKDRKNVGETILFSSIYVGNEIPSDRQLMEINPLYTESSHKRQCNLNVNKNVSSKKINS